MFCRFYCSGVFLFFHLDLMTSFILGNLSAQRTWLASLYLILKSKIQLFTPSCHLSMIEFAFLMISGRRAVLASNNDWVSYSLYSTFLLPNILKQIFLVIGPIMLQNQRPYGHGDPDRQTRCSFHFLPSFSAISWLYYRIQQFLNISETL